MNASIERPNDVMRSCDHMEKEDMTGGRGPIL